KCLDGWLGESKIRPTVESHVVQRKRGALTMASFFIRRPIVAIVIAILTVIVGAITIALLPIAQFPNIAPPEIWLQANYPGADAKNLEQYVATPIEQQVTGVDNIESMYSVNTNNSSQKSLIDVFELTTYHTT